MLLCVSAASVCGLDDRAWAILKTRERRGTLVVAADRLVAIQHSERGGNNVLCVWWYMPEAVDALHVT